MLPKWHVFLGAIFSVIVYFAFNLSLTGAILIFLASVFIDIDHYLIYVYHKKKIGLGGALKYYDELGRREARWIREGKKWKSHIQIFHTVEFILLVWVLAFYFPVLYYILIGMIFHSILDVIWLIKYNAMSLRWFFLSEWIFVKKSVRIRNKYYK